MSSSRRFARELALQLLFQIDVGKVSLKEALKDFSSLHDVPASTKEFCLSLVKGVLDNLEEIDKQIKEVSKNWELSRMNIVDKNVLRLGTYEMLFGSNIPETVAINEAIEIAKKYGSNESGSFVNGILDAIKKIKWKKEN